MTEPKILKKVEELSDEIAINVATGADCPADMESADGKSVIFVPDFRVEPNGRDDSVPCSCYYGGERVKCYYTGATYVESPEKNKFPHNKSLYAECSLRQLAEIFLKGVKKLEEEQE